MQLCWNRDGKLSDNGRNYPKLLREVLDLNHDWMSQRATARELKTSRCFIQNVLVGETYETKRIRKGTARSFVTRRSSSSPGPAVEVCHIKIGTLSNRRFHWRRRRDDRWETGARTAPGCSRKETHFACFEMSKIILHVKRILLKHVTSIFNQSLYHRSLGKEQVYFL